MNTVTFLTVLLKTSFIIVVRLSLKHTKHIHMYANVRRTFIAKLLISIYLFVKVFYATLNNYSLYLAHKPECRGRKAIINNYKVFGMTRPGIEPGAYTLPLHHTCNLLLRNQPCQNET